MTPIITPMFQGKPAETEGEEQMFAKGHYTNLSLRAKETEEKGTANMPKGRHKIG